MVRQRNRSIRAFSTGVLIYLICWIHTANHELQFMPSLFTFTPRVLPSPFDWPIMKTWIPAPFVIVNDQADVVHGTGQNAESTSCRLQAINISSQHFRSTSITHGVVSCLRTSMLSSRLKRHEHTQNTGELYQIRKRLNNKACTGVAAGGFSVFRASTGRKPVNAVVRALKGYRERRSNSETTTAGLCLH